MESEKEKDKRQKQDLLRDKNFTLSYARVEELRNNRVEGDIPLSDEYWKALSKHRQMYSNTNQ